MRNSLVKNTYYKYFSQILQTNGNTRHFFVGYGQGSQFLLNE